MATTEVTGLKLTVTSSIADTKQKLDAVKTSLSKLKIADSKVKAINDLATGVSKFANAINKLDATKINTFGDALKGLGEVEIKKSVINRVNELGEAFANVDVKNLGKSADKLNQALSPLAETMSKISSASKELGINANFGKAVARAEEAYDKVSKQISGKGVKAVEVEPPKKTSMDIFKETVDSRFKNMDKVFDSSSIGKAYGAINKVREAIAYIREEFAKTKVGRFFNELTVAANKAFQAIKQGVQKAIGAIKTFASAMVKVGSTFSNIGFLNPFRSVAESIAKAYNKLKNLTSSLARIAMYRALRTALKEVAKAVREGLTNLYYWSQATGGDFAPAVDKLATAMLYLKNSIGAAVSPIITKFAPAIDIATDKLVGLINVVNQLFARLTGRATWTRALKHPTEFAERASGAAKKVKDNIQGFDELHILRTDNGGGGADSMDYNNMFEETEFSEGLTDWIENLKDAIKAGRWYEAGNIIADEINKVIDNINWGKLGTSLGNKINDMFSFAWGFLHNIDFVKIGSSIATFLNNAINTIDTYQIGQVLARKWTMIFDTLYGFVSTFDFPAFGWKVSELVEGWFDELDGARIGTTISDAIKGALDSAIAFLSNDAMLDKFVEDIAGIINNIDWYGIFCRVLTIATQIANALSDIIDGVMNGTGRQSSSGFDVERVTASAPASIAQRVIANQNYAVSRGWTGSFGDQLAQNIADSVNTADTRSLAEALKNLFTKAWNAIKATLGAIIKEGCTEIVTEAIHESAPHGGIIGNALDWVGGDQHSTLEDNLPWWSQSPAHAISSARRDYGADRESSARTASRNAGNAIFDVVGAIAGGSGGVIGIGRDLGLIKASADRTNKSFTTLARTTKDFAENGGKAIVIQKNSFNDLANVVTEGSKNMTSSFEEFGNKISGDVVNRVLQSKNTISATITSLSDDTKFKMNEMSSSIFASVDNADKAITTPLSNIKSQITTTFREAGSDASNSIKGMGETMNASLKGVVDASKGHLEGYNDLWSQLKGNIKGVSNTVIEGSEKMGNGVTDAFNSILDNLNNFKITTPDGYKFDYNLKKLPKISIPRLATGGIATSATTALIGEAGKEAVLPLENNTEWMNVLAERINGEGNDEVALLREQNDLLRQIASKNVTISSREIFNAVRDENDEYVTRTGKSALAL